MVKHKAQKRKQKIYKKSRKDTLDDVILFVFEDKCICRRAEIYEEGNEPRKVSVDDAYRAKIYKSGYYRQQHYRKKYLKAQGNAFYQKLYVIRASDDKKQKEHRSKYFSEGEIGASDMQSYAYTLANAESEQKGYYIFKLYGLVKPRCLVSHFQSSFVFRMFFVISRLIFVCFSWVSVCFSYVFRFVLSCGFRLFCFSRYQRALHRANTGAVRRAGP